MIQSSIQYIRRLLGRSFGVKNVNSIYFPDSTPFPNKHFATLMSLHIILIVVACNCQIWRILPIAILASAHHANRDILKKKYGNLKWRLRNAVKGRIFFFPSFSLSLFHYKEESHLICYVTINSSHFVRIDSNNRSDESSFNIKRLKMWLI